MKDDVRNRIGKILIILLEILGEKSLEYEIIYGARRGSLISHLLMSSGKIKFKENVFNLDVYTELYTPSERN